MSLSSFSTIIPVPLAERAYQVSIGHGAPEEAARRVLAATGEVSGVAFLVDGNLGQLSPRVDVLMAAVRSALSPRVLVARHDLPAGEGCKTLGEVERTAEWMAAEGFDRGALVVAIGGGATSDHAGFVAAIYLRGVRFALFPTTLLAMVDASVGGKTGVDLGAGKNLVGAFHQPRAVIADLAFLATLPARERLAGLAEVVKCGLIADDSLLDVLETQARSLASATIDETLGHVIAGAVRVKAEVVTEDERESGRRAILNFGHTVGHALEAASRYQLLHGEAVSLGMMAALALGVSLGITPPKLETRVRSLLEHLGLPVDFERRLDAEVLARIDVDKKRRAGAVRFVFVTAPGCSELREVGLGELRARLLEIAAASAAPSERG
jgi:3-dehydroquinate synthase